VFTEEAVQRVKCEKTAEQAVLKVEVKTEVEEDRDQLEHEVSFCFVLCFFFLLSVFNVEANWCDKNTILKKNILFIFRKMKKMTRILCQYFLARQTLLPSQAHPTVIRVLQCPETNICVVCATRLFLSLIT
jgi:hypothetical protein